MSAIDTGGVESVRVGAKSAPDREDPVNFQPADPNEPAMVVEWTEYEPGQRFRVLAVVRADEDVHVAEALSLPGAISQGATVDEALDALREAVAGCIESYRQAGEPVPWDRALPPHDAAGEMFYGWIDVDV